jgi:hypothetical protein
MIFDMREKNAGLDDATSFHDKTVFAFCRGRTSMDRNHAAQTVNPALGDDLAAFHRWTEARSRFMGTPMMARCRR